MEDFKETIFKMIEEEGLSNFAILQRLNGKVKSLKELKSILKETYQENGYLFVPSKGTRTLIGKGLTREVLTKKRGEKTIQKIASEYSVSKGLIAIACKEFGLVRNKEDDEQLFKKIEFKGMDFTKRLKPINIMKEEFFNVSKYSLAKMSKRSKESVNIEKRLNEAGLSDEKLIKLRNSKPRQSYQKIAKDFGVYYGDIWKRALEIGANNTSYSGKVNPEILEGYLAKGYTTAEIILELQKEGYNISYQAINERLRKNGRYEGVLIEKGRNLIKSGKFDDIILENTEDGEQDIQQIRIKILERLKKENDNETDVLFRMKDIIHRKRKLLSKNLTNFNNDRRQLILRIISLLNEEQFTGKMVERYLDSIGIKMPEKYVNLILYRKSARTTQKGNKIKAMQKVGIESMDKEEDIKEIDSFLISKVSTDPKTTLQDLDAVIVVLKKRLELVREQINNMEDKKNEIHNR